jgi:hypothetical protein
MRDAGVVSILRRELAEHTSVPVASTRRDHYRNLDNTVRLYPAIASTWQQASITPAKRVAFYCGTGWRASEARRRQSGMATARRTTRSGDVPGASEEVASRQDHERELGSPAPMATTAISSS